MKRIIRSTRQISRRRPIRAADEKAAPEDTRFDDLADTLKDDFEYAFDGFDKLVRSGKLEEALGIMSSLSDAINVAIQDSASEITM